MDLTGLSLKNGIRIFVAFSSLHAYMSISISTSDYTPKPK